MGMPRRALDRITPLLTRRKLRWPALLVAWAVLVGGLAGFLAQSQERSRAALDERFAARAQMASRFVKTYVDDLVERQREVAELRLAAGRVSQRTFGRVATEGGFEAAVLLDGRGRLAEVFPPKPQMLGSDMTGKYAHLRRAMTGTVAVSDVVPSAVRGTPVVAFAVPFETKHGTRVYSGAYDVSRTPLGAYLDNAIPVRNARLYLLDRSGQVIAKNGSPLRAVAQLARLEPALARASQKNDTGTFETTQGDQRYVSQRISGTPWRIVIAVPAELLHRSIEGASLWAPWAAVAGVALFGLLVISLLIRLLAGRARLESANWALERLARVDSLTGLPNRRHVEESLAALSSSSRRHGLELAVMLIDIDRFKGINDVHGHRAGDEVLRAVAERLREPLRTEDVIGRWGGEEFLIALVGADAEAAGAVAERVRAAVADTPIELSSGPTLRVTATVGVVGWTHEGVEQIVSDADAALYRGKSAGRDIVVAA